MSKLKRALRNLAQVVISACVLSQVVAGNALAASNIGQNIGQMLLSWSRWLWLGVVSVIGIHLLIKRDVSQIVVTLFAAVVVGGFVVFGTGILDIIDQLWKTVKGG